MEEGETVTVESSEYGHIPVGTTLTVSSDRTNQFTGRRTILVSADTSVPNRLDGGWFSMYQMPDNTWREIFVGLSREHEIVTLK